MRQIKIYTTVGTGGTIDTNARTLGELKPLLMEQGINFDNMKLVVGETKAELSLDEALLPESNFKIYLMPAKTKSGADFDEMEEKIEEMEIAVSRIESKVIRIESKVEQILAKVNSNSCNSAVASKPLSQEDEESIAELRRLSGGNSGW